MMKEAMKEWDYDDDDIVGLVCEEDVEMNTNITEKTIDGLRETLQLIEDAGTRYNEELYPGKYGTIWVDKDNGIYYEHVTDDLDLSVDDMSDEDLKDIGVGEYR